MSKEQIKERVMQEIVIGIVAFIAGLLFATWLHLEVREDKVKTGIITHDGVAYRLVKLEDSE